MQKTTGKRIALLLRNMLLYSLALLGLFFVLLIVFVPKSPPRESPPKVINSPSATVPPAKQIILVPTKIPTETSAPTATSTPTPTPIPTNTPLPTTTNTPVPLAPPFDEIRTNMNAMTDAQWEAYTPGLKGLAVVDWQGWVEDVSAENFGAYKILVDMDSPQELFSLYDVEFHIKGALALRLRKDSAIAFSGKIKRVYKVLGTMLVDVDEVSIAP